MKNQYMFFQKQQFDDLPLDDYKLTDRNIPNTDVHIYSFECIETDSICDEPSMAKKLDELSQTLSEKYSELYITISSESSQYFCKELYPLVVSFEIKLRQAVAISRALYEKGNVDLGSFYFDVDKKKKTEDDFYIIPVSKYEMSAYETIAFATGIYGNPYNTSSFDYSYDITESFYN